jgi:hypothetical protein
MGVVLSQANRLKTTRQAQHTSTLRRFQFIPPILWFLVVKSPPSSPVYQQKLVFPTSKIENPPPKKKAVFSAEFEIIIFKSQQYLANPVLTQLLQ